MSKGHQVPFDYRVWWSFNKCLQSYKFLYFLPRYGLEPCLNMLEKPAQVLLILDVLSTSVRIRPNLYEKGEKLNKLVRRPVYVWFVNLRSKSAFLSCFHFKTTCRTCMSRRFVRLRGLVRPDDLPVFSVKKANDE